MSFPVEVMVSGPLTRAMHAVQAPESHGFTLKVEEIFGRQNWTAFTAVSNSNYNEAIGQTVISAIYGVIPDYLSQAGAKAAQRKFHLESASVYDKIYRLQKVDEQCPALPSSAKVYAIGETHCVAGYSGDASVEQFRDVYFSADKSDIESMFNTQVSEGKFSTYYALTYNKETLEVVRTKVYQYDSAAAGDWDLALEIALSTENAA